MANSKELFSELVNNIRLAESKDEVQSIVYLILETRFGLGRTDILSNREIEADIDLLKSWIERINNQEPVQYILGEGWFYGRKFHVDPSVLIPRAETELLIQSVLSLTEKQRPVSIIDIGTGSGCIAITLAKELPNSKIYATDISVAALMTAVENAGANNAVVEFIHHNILVDNLSMFGLDFLVSNPPYVTHSEKVDMKSNVLDNEPHSALFVSDESPLVFYLALANAGTKVLRQGGYCVVEINERFADAVASVFLKAGYGEINVIKDFAGKDRIFSARLTGITNYSQ